MNGFCTRIACTISAFSNSLFFCRQHSLVQLRAVLSLGVYSTILLVTTHGAAEASGALNLDTYSKAVSTKTNIIVDIVSYVCYLGGAILSALGIVDMKKHVENPTQTPLKNGLAKLGFGGILLALPFVSGIMQATMSGGEGNAKFQQFQQRPIIQ